MSVRYDILDLLDQLDICIIKNFCKRTGLRCSIFKNAYRNGDVKALRDLSISMICDSEKTEGVPIKKSEKDKTKEFYKKVFLHCLYWYNQNSRDKELPAEFIIWGTQLLFPNHENDGIKRNHQHISRSSELTFVTAFYALYKMRSENSKRNIITVCTEALAYAKDTNQENKEREIYRLWKDRKDSSYEELEEDINKLRKTYIRVAKGQKEVREKLNSFRGRKLITAFLEKPAIAEISLRDTFIKLRNKSDLIGYSSLLKDEEDDGNGMDFSAGGFIPFNVDNSGDKSPFRFYREILNAIKRGGSD